MTTSPRKIAFIGAGNMTQSIVRGMVQSGYPAEFIYVSNPSRPKLDKMQRELGVNISQQNAEIAATADVIVLSVKPQLMADVCTALREQVSELSGKLIVSIAAGIRIEKYRQYLGADIRIIRVMPNTPSLVGQGMSGLVADSRATEADRNYITAAFDGVGVT